MRAPIGGGTDSPLALDGDVHVAAVDFWPNAVDKTGRIVAQVVRPNSVVWPVGVIDPNTGHVQIVRIGYDFHGGAGWAPDGKLILNVVSRRGSIWRFPPEGSNR